MHSGRQFGGDPLNSGKQEHAGELPVVLHKEFGPQGFGSHGFIGTGKGVSSAKIK